MPLYGPRWPLSAGEEDAFKLYDDIKDQINFYLKCLLLTSPGENISDSGYGVGIRSYLFEQNIDSVRGNIGSKIQNQISRYMGYLRIVDISVSATDAEVNENTLSIKITYYIPKGTTEEIFELNFSPNTNIGFY
tara:strand:+ start:359 stop:760 length:402 start_codon:yes stop_codon:yes gene_type:complete